MSEPAVPLVLSGITIETSSNQKGKTNLSHAKFSLLVLVGIGFGALINYMEPRVFPEFGPELFFHWLLPPIILEAAYSLYHRAFLQNIGTILLFAVVVSMQHSSVYAAHFQSFRPTPSTTGPSFRTSGPSCSLQWW
jgi:NhaP-type Na+/H+ or K+/H+ antiporter